MQATMSAVESYVGSDNLNGVTHMGPTFDGGAAAAFKPVMPPEFAAPISSYPVSGGDSAVATAAAAAASGEKRKRGRPRKFPVEDAIVPVSGFPATTPNGKRRGRPPGSGKKQGGALLGSSAARLNPQILTVQAGEDVSLKVMSLCQNGSQAVCILSANGAISNVTIRQASSSGGTVTYEGRFEILSLSGSFIMLESGGQRSRTGGLSILLAGPDGRVLGGGVAGLLVAATPVQMVVGSFVVGQEPKSPAQVDYSAGPPKPIIGSPVMRGTPPSESSGSPIHQSNGNNNNNSMEMQWK